MSASRSLPTIEICILFYTHSPYSLLCKSMCHCIDFKPGISNSNWSEYQMRIYKVTTQPHHDADATMAVPKPRNSFYILFPAKGI